MGIRAGQAPRSGKTTAGPASALLTASSAAPPTHAESGRDGHHERATDQVPRTRDHRAQSKRSASGSSARRTGTRGDRGTRRPRIPAEAISPLPPPRSPRPAPTPRASRSRRSSGGTHPARRERIDRAPAQLQTGRTDARHIGHGARARSSKRVPSHPQRAPHSTRIKLNGMRVSGSRRIRSPAPFVGPSKTPSTRS